MQNEQPEGRIINVQSRKPTKKKEKRVKLPEPPSKPHCENEAMAYAERRRQMSGRTKSAETRK